MGEVRVDIRLKGPKGELELKNILVDTGATYTVLGKRDLEEVGAYKMRDTLVALGNKERVKAASYAAAIGIGERECNTIILTFKDAERVMGLLTLESLGLKVNPIKGELEPTREANLAYFFIQKVKDENLLHLWAEERGCAVAKILKETGIKAEQLGLSGG